MNKTLSARGRQTCADLYTADDRWAKLPSGISWIEVAAIAIDSKDRVFVFNRGDHPVLVFNRDGTFATAWGQGLFNRPHGITIGPDNSVYCTDDLGHSLRKFSPEGKLLQTFGPNGVPSKTGATSVDFRTILRASGPFHYPTNSALDTQGGLYVSDGYGNARVHHFAADGKLLRSWGEPGGGPGQFRVPHGIALSPTGNLFVADRENSRVQIFTPSGEYLDEMRDLARPSQIAFDLKGNCYVAELGYRAGMWPGTSPPSADATGGCVSVFNPEGKLLARWGGGDNPTHPGDFFAPHDIAIDSHGDVYVAEVVWSAGGNRGLVSPDCHSLQKFIRKNGAHS